MELPKPTDKDYKQFGVVMTCLFGTIFIFWKFGLGFGLVTTVISIATIWCSYLMNYHPEMITEFEKK